MFKKLLENCILSILRIPLALLGVVIGFLGIVTVTGLELLGFKLVNKG